MKSLIIANWKMNPQTEKEAKELFSLVKNGLKNTKGADVVICPPFVYLSNVNYQLLNVKMGVQNCFYEEKGAYTGEISCQMLKSLGCKYVIVGHSERRKHFNETDEIINKKLKAILDAKLIPVFCIGETKEERDKGEIPEVFKKQIEFGLKNVSGFRFQASGAYIAYEPVWAIGTGKSCDVEEAQKMKLLIQKIISKIYNPAFSQKIPILYGGSVNSKNAGKYIKEAGFNGLLVGGASLDAKEFIKIVKEAV